MVTDYSVQRLWKVAEACAHGESVVLASALKPWHLMPFNVDATFKPPEVTKASTQSTAATITRIKLPTPSFPLTITSVSFDIPPSAAGSSC